MGNNSFQNDLIQYLNISQPKPPELMNNVINVFVHGIPKDSFNLCAEEVDFAVNSQEDLRNALSVFIRRRLQKLAIYEYHAWINGQIPFITPREIQLWRLRQFVEFLWFWNLPDDDDLALIFNLTKRKASNLASDFLARFKKTLLFPVAIRRFYEMMHQEPLKKGVDHPKKNWVGCLYHLDYHRNLELLNSLISEIPEFRQIKLIGASYYDREENIIWIPTDLREIMISDDDLRDELFDIYPLI